MRDLRILMLAMLLGACPDVVKEDDPRTVGSGGGGDAGSTDKGYCSGSSVFCEDRSQSQCNSGCTFEPVCHSPSLERCASVRDPNTCDSDSACHWIADTCEPKSGSACGVYASQTACQNDPLHECLWGPACTGDRAYCIDLHTASSCMANIGCNWVAQ
jgi:hypothetical protein